VEALAHLGLLRHEGGGEDWNLKGLIPLHSLKNYRTFHITYSEATQSSKAKAIKLLLPEHKEYEGSDKQWRRSP